MNIQIVNGQKVQLKPAVDHFIIKQKPSSNVEYYGYGPDGDIFVQFKNGVSYIYLDAGSELIQEMQEAESIGSFVNQKLARNKALQSVRHNESLVQAVKDEQA